jgi:sec-independent protein translocase protein TatB
MFEIGFQEIVVIALLALIVLGPEKLPKLAAKLGHWTGKARGMARNLRQQLENEVSYDDLLKQKQEAEDALRKATEAPMDFHAQMERDIQTALDPVIDNPSASAAPAEPAPPPAEIAAAPEPAPAAADTPHTAPDKNAAGTST